MLQLTTHLRQLCIFLGSRKIQELKTESTHFSANEFADKLVNYSLQEGTHSVMQAAHWINLGAAVQSFFKNPPTFAFMLGSFSRHPLQKKERVKRQRLAEDNGKEKRTNVKMVIDDQEQLETTAHDVSRRILPTLKDLYKRSKHPLDYFEFVIDPDSFGVTVENMFHVSFLIRDGLAQISLDEDKLPVIEPTSGVLGSREDKDKALQSLPRKQLINNFSVSQWRRLIQTYNITKARIPRRSVPQASQSH